LAGQMGLNPLALTENNISVSHLDNCWSTASPFSTLREASKLSRVYRGSLSEEVINNIVLDQDAPPSKQTHYVGGRMSLFEYFSSSPIDSIFK
jgi:hypothetical protein